MLCDTKKQIPGDLLYIQMNCTITVLSNFTPFCKHYYFAVCHTFREPSQTQGKRLQEVLQLACLTGRLYNSPAPQSVISLLLMMCTTKLTTVSFLTCRELLGFCLAVSCLTVSHMCNYNNPLYMHEFVFQALLYSAVLFLVYLAS